MIQASFDNAAADLDARQLAEARVEADSILAAVEKAKRNEAYSQLSEAERVGLTAAIEQLQAAYQGEDYKLIRDKIEALDHAGHTLAENMMNTAVRGALKGTKI
jgi:molecular chaperone DnaK (HSP70)